MNSGLTDPLSLDSIALPFNPLPADVTNVFSVKKTKTPQFFSFHSMVPHVG